MGHTSSAGADPPGRSAKRRACIAVSMAGSYEVAHVVADIGGRAEMEDEHVLEVDSVHPLRVLGGIFDGHGGTSVARLAKTRFPSLFRAALASGLEAAFRSSYAAIQKESEAMAGGARAVAVRLDCPPVALAHPGGGHAGSGSGAR